MDRNVDVPQGKRTTSYILGVSELLIFLLSLMLTKEWVNGTNSYTWPVESKLKLAKNASWDAWKKEPCWTITKFNIKWLDRKKSTVALCLNNCVASPIHVRTSQNKHSEPPWAMLPLSFSIFMPEKQRQILAKNIFNFSHHTCSWLYVHLTPYLFQTLPPCGWRLCTDYFWRSQARPLKWPRLVFTELVRW